MEELGDVGVREEGEEGVEVGAEVGFGADVGRREGGCFVGVVGGEHAAAVEFVCCELRAGCGAEEVAVGDGQEGPGPVAACAGDDGAGLLED